MRTWLTSGWEIAATAPGAIEQPDAALQDLDWLPAESLGTVAAILRAKGLWDLNTVRRLDAEDWWFRLRFTAPAGHADDELAVLGFDGLATLADAWLNGTHLLTSSNMFTAHIARMQGLRCAENALVLCFRSLDAALKLRRPRPRWRAPLVEHQQLRWFRTTLLGRLPGWSPPIAPVGPWRSIWLETHPAVRIGAPVMRTQVQGHSGTVRANCEVHAGNDTRISRVELVITREQQSHQVTMSRARDGNEHAFCGELTLDPVALWWPHTHGEPALYAARMDIYLSGDEACAVSFKLGNIGFRTLTLDLTDDNFALHVNGEKIFCRGACWTPLDIVSLNSGPTEIEAALTQFATAGLNMLRVGGTMVYENDAFLDACDAKGILLWQDFMFANMDYPEGDGAFDSSVTTECRQLLARLSGRPCVAVLCGNSEGEQQAAMWGAPRERWLHGLFNELLPRLVSELAPDIPYWPSSAHGGAFPHQGNAGTTSYYGVGAYLRPLTDARRAEIRFATECLGFANVPEDDALAVLSPSGDIKVHSPAWKARVPRDLGAGWDFDDVRDFYFREIFGVDPLAVRYAAHERYLEMSRVVSGEVMAAAFREWRRKRSTCNGALIWFLRDLWAGAGWGIIDATGAPKAPYYCLKRLLQPRAIFLSDEGGNGVFAHIVNETAMPFEATLEISLLQTGSSRATVAHLPIMVPARQALEIPVASLLEGFTDLSYAYRFGAPPYEAVVASLLDANGQSVGRDFYFPLGHKPLIQIDVGLSATVRVLSDGDAVLEISAERLARFVTARVPGFVADDQYFHLGPGMRQRVQLRRIASAREPVGEVRALNSSVARKIVLS